MTTVADALAALRDLSADTLAVDDSVHVQGVPREEAAPDQGAQKEFSDSF